MLYKESTGHWRTESLFFEQNVRKARRVWDKPPVFTLYEDRDGLINARKTFVELNDPSGYKWAIKYLGDWNHWQRLMKCQWFQTAVNAWRDELVMKLQSEAIDVIKEIAQTPEHKSALPAARYLHELGKQSGGRGRPSKATIDAELKREVEARTDTDLDAERIGLRVVQGGRP